jgi:hypothetical protein
MSGHGLIHVSASQQPWPPKLRIHPGGITVTLVFNTFGIARTVREVLASRPRLRQAEQTKRRSPVDGPTVTG